MALGFGGILTFLPSLKTRWALRDKKEQLSNLGLLRTRGLIGEESVTQMGRWLWHSGTGTAGILTVGTMAASHERVLCSGESWGPQG